MDPFGVAHVSDKIASRAVLLGGITIVLGRFISEAEDRRWLPLLFMVGYLLKGAAIFYPSFFSPDVLTHGRYVLAFPSDGDSLEARGVVAQEKSNIAYPRSVGGKRYAFPYSPLFYLPFTGLSDRAEVDEALKYAALAAAGMILVYRRGEPAVFRPMLAYSLTFALLLSLRGLSGGLFKDLKEILFVGPLIAIAASASILEIAKRSRTGQIAAVLIMSGLMIFWAAAYRADLQTFCSLAGLSR